MQNLNFILAGVGGQGTILASDILVEVGLKAGYDVKKSEVHGMSQRGGGVESHVRWGQKVYSPVVEQGKVDYLLGFEMLEGARWVTYLNSQAKVYINDHKIYPPSVNIGQATYPEKRNIEQLFAGRSAAFEWVNANSKAIELGNQALAGVVMLGRLSRELNVSQETWLEVIAELVPVKFIELNKQAFLGGWEIEK